MNFSAQDTVLYIDYLKKQICILYSRDSQCVILKYLTLWKLYYNFQYIKNNSDNIIYNVINGNICIYCNFNHS